MTARRLEGRPVADSIWVRVDERVQRLRARGMQPPRLALLLGEDEAAATYARQIERAFERHALATIRLPAPPTASEQRAALASISDDPTVDGVLVLAPLPGGTRVEEVADAVDPRKDVDGITPTSAGRLLQRLPAFAPATAVGGLRILEHYGTVLRGTPAVVVGRSAVVGLPLALLLVQADSTVTICHTRTRDLGAVTREAEVLCVAAGRPGTVRAEQVRKGAVILDFGINVTPEGTLVGDVASDVWDVASAVTPVPGGTGPVTVAVLAEHTVRAAASLRDYTDLA